MNTHFKYFMSTNDYKLQEGQHPLTGQRAANFTRDLAATYDFN